MGRLGLHTWVALVPSYPGASIFVSHSNATSTPCAIPIDTGVCVRQRSTTDSPFALPIVRVGAAEARGGANVMNVISGRETFLPARCTVFSAVSRCAVVLCVFML